MKYEFDAPVSRVFALLTDGKFLRERCLALGELAADCKVSKSAGAPVVTMKREVKRELPTLLGKFFNPIQKFEIVEHWDGDGDARTADYLLQILGQPVTVAADIELAPKGKGSVYTINHKCTARVPLISGPVEKFVLSQTEDGCRRELEYLAEALGRKRK